MEESTHDGKSFFSIADETLSLHQLQACLKHTADWLLIIDNTSFNDLNMHIKHFQQHQHQHHHHHQQQQQQSKLHWTHLLPTQTGHCLILSQSTVLPNAISSAITAATELQPLNQHSAALLLATLTHSQHLTSNLPTSKHTSTTTTTTTTTTPQPSHQQTYKRTSNQQHSTTHATTHDTQQLTSQHINAEKESLLWITSQQALSTLPLALKLFADYINNSHINFQQAAQHLSTIITISEYSSHTPLPQHNQHQHQLPHFHTHFIHFLKTLETKLTDNALRLLLLLSFFDSQHIPLHLIHHTVTCLPGYQHDQDAADLQHYTNTLLAELRHFSLLSYVSQHLQAQTAQRDFCKVSPALPEELATVNQVPVLQLHTVIKRSAQHLISASLETTDTPKWYHLSNWTVYTAIRLACTLKYSCTGAFIDACALTSITSIIMHCRPRLQQVIAYQVAHSDTHNADDQSETYITTKLFEELEEFISCRQSIAVARAYSIDYFQDRPGDTLYGILQRAVQKISSPSKTALDSRNPKVLPAFTRWLQSTPRPHRLAITNILLTIVSMVRKASHMFFSHEIDHWTHYFHGHSTFREASATASHSQASHQILQAMNDTNITFIWAALQLTSPSNRRSQKPPDELLHRRLLFNQHMALIHNLFPSLVKAAVFGLDSSNPSPPGHTTSDGIRHRHTVNYANKPDLMILCVRNQLKTLLQAPRHEASWIRFLLTHCILLLCELNTQPALVVHERMKQLYQTSKKIPINIQHFLQALFVEHQCQTPGQQLSLKLEEEDLD